MDPFPVANNPPIRNVHIAGPAIIPAGNQPPIMNVPIAAAAGDAADGESDDNEGVALVRRLSMKQQMMPWPRTKVAALQLVKVVHKSVAMTLRQVRAMELVVVLVELVVVLVELAVVKLAVVELVVVELAVVELAVVETRRNKNFKNKRNPSYFYSRLSVDG